MAEKLKRNDEAVDESNPWAHYADEVVEWDYDGNKKAAEKTEQKLSKAFEPEPAFEGQLNAMAEAHVERTAEESEKKEGGVVDWEKIKSVFDDERYQILGHGTTSKENAEGILAEGLHVGNRDGYSARDTDISSSFLALGNNNPDHMQAAMNNWIHNNAKQIVIYRIPWQYKTAPGDGAEAYVPFFTGDKSSGTYDKEYAYGWYDAEKKQMHLNPDYHGDLDNKKDVAYLQREKARIKKHLRDAE